VSSDTASVGYGKLETVPPPIGGAPGKMSTVNGGNTTTPNICIEGGRIEFVKSPIDCGDEKQDYLKVIVIESVYVIIIFKNRNFFNSLQYLEQFIILLLLQYNIIRYEYYIFVSFSTSFYKYISVMRGINYTLMKLGL